MSSEGAPLTRRRFLGTAALAGAAPLFLSACSRAPAANRITLGFIGLGVQGRALLGGFLNKKDVEVLAVCDVDTNRREYSRKQVEDYYGRPAGGCAAYVDFRDLLARKEIDAVCIATPDHWHALPVMMACAAQKDVYCEKPLSLTIPEGRAMVTAVRQQARVLQTGSMQRSSKEFRKACELVRNGRIGKVRQVIVDVGGPSQWCDLPAEPPEPGLAWDFWLGPAPRRPYHSVLSPRGVHKHFPLWRNYREYAGGGMTDWGAHHFDIAQWGLGMDESGPVDIIPPADPKAGRGARFLYANGVEMVHGDSRGVLFIGERGKIFVKRGKFEAEPDDLDEAPIPEQGIHLYKSTDHQRDFLECVRARRRPICDVEIGHRSATVCHLGNLAYWYHRRLKWDPAAEQFIGDAEANTWLDRPRRPPWDKL